MDALSLAPQGPPPQEEDVQVLTEGDKRAPLLRPPPPGGCPHHQDVQLSHIPVSDLPRPRCALSTTIIRLENRVWKRLADTSLAAVRQFVDPDRHQRDDFLPPCDEFL